MDSMRDMDRAIEREIQKGSCPLRFEKKGFGEYSYNEITSKGKYNYKEVYEPESN